MTHDIAAVKILHFLNKLELQMASAWQMSDFLVNLPMIFLTDKKFKLKYKVFNEKQINHIDMEVKIQHWLAYKCVVV